MDKKNSKQTDHVDRKQEKKDGGNLRKVDKSGKKVEIDANVSKVLPDRLDLEKGDKPQKKAADDTHDAKVPLEKEDLKKTTKKIVEIVSKVITDRGDLKRADKEAKNVTDDINNAKLPPDRGDLKKSSKKAVEIIHKAIADRGDLKKTDKQTNKPANSNTYVPQPVDKADTDRKEKPKLNVTIKTDETKNIEHLKSRESVKKLSTDIIRTIPSENRKIREKYTLKPKNPPVVTNLTKNETQDRIRKLNDTKEESKEHKQSVTTLNFVKPERKETVQRKPIIRTISSKNDNSKIYKAVTFVDQKKNKPTVLIKIPNELRHPKNLRSSEMVSVKKVKSKMSGDSVKERETKNDRKKMNKTKRLVTSPDLSAKMRSPPTEVAKWAPSCINRHTKPYYEAWVSTTLAAISKNSKKDKLFLEKQNILQKFQRALAERPETPELMYENFNDERYTGKIKVKHR